MKAEKMPASGNTTGIIEFWLMIIIAAILIFALYRFHLIRKREREESKYDVDIQRRRQERFRKRSRYTHQLLVLLSRYPSMNKNPQIVLNVFLENMSRFDKFDLRNYLTSVLKGNTRYDEIIRQATEQKRDADAFKSALDEIRPTRRWEAALLNLSMDECRRMEKTLAGEVGVTTAKNFVVCHLDCSTSTDHAEKTITMTFDDFRAFCEESSGLKHIATQITRDLESAPLENKAKKNGQFMSKDEFDEAYSQNYEHDRPGVYIILLYDSDIQQPTTSNYSDVYVGQSATVYHRVRQHFTGHGNGDVYADIKYGKTAYVKLVLCRVRELNDLEKRYIAEYDATSSYNNTKGGAAKR